MLLIWDLKLNTAKVIFDFTFLTLGLSFQLICPWAFLLSWGKRQKLRAEMGTIMFFIYSWNTLQNKEIKETIQPVSSIKTKVILQVILLKNERRALGYSYMVQHSPSVSKALGSIPSSAKKIKTKTKDHGEGKQYYCSFFHLSTVLQFNLPTELLCRKSLLDHKIGTA